MLYLLLIFLSSLLLFYKYSTRNKNYWRKRNILQEDGLLQNFLTGKCSLGEVYDKIYKKHSKEKYIGVFLSQPAVIVKDIQDIQAVLQGDFQSFSIRGIITNPRDILADNVLFTNDYRRWRLLRQKMSPIFTSRKLKNMFYIMDRCARDFIENSDNLQLINTNSFVAISAYITSCIAATVFGLGNNTKSSIDSPFLQMVKEVAEPNFMLNLKFAISTFSPFLFRFINLKFFSDQEDFFIDTFKKVLDNRHRTKDVRYDFIDTCIELQNNGKMQDNSTEYELDPTDETLAAQGFSFFLAGVDTSAITMHFTLLELASNPKILSRLHQEIDEVFAKCRDALTYEAVDNMKYLDMVLNETMRKYPPVGHIQRQCTNKTVLPAGGIQIKKDEIVVIPVYALHRDENYFPNPDMFDPERFAPKNIKNIQQFSYLPFGEGNRICIGERFARLQVKSGIAWFLRNHTFKERIYKPKKFDKSPFNTKDIKANIELIPRNDDKLI